MGDVSSAVGAIRAPFQGNFRVGDDADGLKAGFQTQARLPILIRNNGSISDAIAALHADGTGEGGRRQPSVAGYISQKRTFGQMTERDISGYGAVVRAYAG
jgi:hypothetical protein